MNDKLNFEDIDSLMNQVAMFKREFSNLLKTTSNDDILGISMLQFHLLNMVYKSHFSNQNEIANELHVSKATLSVRIERLVNMGLISREVDLQDKRNYVLNLTDLGKEKIKEGRKIICHSMIPILDGFSKEELEAIKNIVSRLQININKIKEDL